MIYGSKSEGEGLQDGNDAMMYGLDMMALAKRSEVEEL